MNKNDDPFEDSKADETFDSFVMYKSVIKVFKKLHAEEAKVFLTTVFDYMFDGVEPEEGSLPENVNHAWNLVYPELSAQRKRKLAGRKGGNARKAKGGAKDGD